MTFEVPLRAQQDGPPVKPKDAATVLVKCEFMNPAGSIKDRMALHIIEKGEKSGQLRPGDSVRFVVGQAVPPAHCDRPRLLTTAPRLPAVGMLFAETGSALLY